MSDDILCFKPVKPTYRLILLHGWGADAEDLLPLAKSFCAINPSEIELVIFRAPTKQSVGEGREWYGLFPHQWSQVPAAIKSLQERLASFESSEIPLERTILLGFSQGGAMALAAGADLPFGGLIICSGYLHPGWSPPEFMPPVYLTHGYQDEIVEYSSSESIFTLLKKNNIKVSLYGFDCGHTISEEMLIKLTDILKLYFV